MFVIGKTEMPFDGVSGFYNANTDMTVQANRGQAIKTVCDGMSDKLFTATFSIRYASGYYLTYIVNRVRLANASDIRYHVIELNTPASLLTNLKSAFWIYIPSSAPEVVWSI